MVLQRVAGGIAFGSTFHGMSGAVGAHLSVEQAFAYPPPSTPRPPFRAPRSPHPLGFS